MTRSEARTETSRQLSNARETLRLAKSQGAKTRAVNKIDYLVAVQKALCEPTREMVERMRGMILSDVSGWDGSWNAKCSRCGATIGLGSEGEYDITHKYRFCPMCMSPFTNEAVDMMLKRLEALKDD